MTLSRELFMDDMPIVSCSIRNYHKYDRCGESRVKPTESYTENRAKNINKDPIKMRFLPPAKDVCEGCVFTGVCLSAGGYLPHCRMGYTPPPGPEAEPPPETRGRHPPGKPPLAVQSGIRSTSGRYASHWNAFLFNF